MTDASDPLELYDELVMDGEAPEPADFARRYPDHPDLLARIHELDGLRSQLDDAIGIVDQAQGPLPESIAGFRILEPLGEGGMGRVFVAEEADSGQRCALKILRWESKTALKRFEREAQLAVRLKHIGIARVVAYGVDEGRAYLATELVEGCNLRDWVARRRGNTPFPDTSAIRARLALIERVARALGFAHRQGIVHRDVKPSNIMVTHDGLPKLIDFGIALPSDGRHERFTRTGVFIGSHAYAAPEQLRGDKEAIGPWTDTYALAATLFEIVALRLPFPAGTLAARLNVAADKPAHGPRHYNAAITRDCDKLVLRALAPKPKKRFADGDQLAAGLSRLLS